MQWTARGHQVREEYPVLNLMAISMGTSLTLNLFSICKLRIEMLGSGVSKGCVVLEMLTHGKAAAPHHPLICLLTKIVDKLCGARRVRTEGIFLQEHPQRTKMFSDITTTPCANLRNLTLFLCCYRPCSLCGEFSYCPIPSKLLPSGPDSGDLGLCLMDGC